MNLSNNTRKIKTENCYEKQSVSEHLSSNEKNCETCIEEEHCECAQCQNRIQKTLIKGEYDDENNWVFVEQLINTDDEKNIIRNETIENVNNNNTNVIVKSENKNDSAGNTVQSSFSTIPKHRKQIKKGKVAIGVCLN